MWIDGRFSHILPPGLYAYWTTMRPYLLFVSGAAAYLLAIAAVISEAAAWALRHAFDAILADPPVVHLSFYFAKDYGETQCLRRWCW